MDRVYFDYAASAPLRPEAREAFVNALDCFGNPASIHAEGQRARALLDAKRLEIGRFFGVRAERVVFTSGATEANNIVIRGFNKTSSCILVSAIEHDSVLEPAAHFGRVLVGCGADGRTSLDALKALLERHSVGLVAVMHANNETGVIQPIREVADLCHAYGTLLLVDAVQTTGHLPVRMDDLGADFLTFSAHKFGGPKGVGGLLVRPEIRLEALMTGGGQERNRRAGTENLPGIAAMAAALKAAHDHMDTETATARAIGQTLAGAIKARQGATIIAEGSDRVPHVMQVRFAGKSGEDTVIAMDMRGVAISRGSACSSGRTHASHVLRAMGFDEEAAGEAVRFSWGWGSTVAEAELVIGNW